MTDPAFVSELRSRSAALISRASLEGDSPTWELPIIDSSLASLVRESIGSLLKSRSNAKFESTDARYGRKITGTWRNRSRRCALRISLTRAAVSRGSRAKCVAGKTARSLRGSTHVAYQIAPWITMGNSHRTRLIVALDHSCVISMW